MLTEERHSFILKEIEEKSVVYVSELVKVLDTSDSTIRRDLNLLHKEGKLKKVHGGATSLKNNLNIRDEEFEHRQKINIDEKNKIAKYAASLIEEDDFVYIDAGTSTDLIINYINTEKTIFVTNGINQAKSLIKKGLKAYILGGEIKLQTEAIIGIEAINSLKKYNFTKGFFGVNGVSIDRGFTTPDLKEALVKEEALKRTNEAYILADSSKFNEVSNITFGILEDAAIITTKIEDNRYYDIAEILEVWKWYIQSHLIQHLTT